MIAVERLLNAVELASALGISPRTLELLVSRGDVPAPLRVGRHRKWRPADVNAWINERASEASGRASEIASATGEGDQKARGP